MCIGTDPNMRSPAGESCNFPVLSVAENFDTDQVGSTAIDAALGGLWSAARECYMTDAGAAVTGFQDIKKATVGDPVGCDMKFFVQNHRENYLILTNMVNPDVVGISNINLKDQLRKADIYYRVLSRTCAEGETDCPELVRDYADIQANGYANNDAVVKSLDVKYKAPGFLPVFNFSLYKTSDKPKKT